MTDKATGPSGTGAVTRTDNGRDWGHDEADDLDLRRHEQCDTVVRTVGSSVAAATGVTTGAGSVRAVTGVTTGTVGDLDWVLDDEEDTEVNMQRRGQ